MTTLEIAQQENSKLLDNIRSHVVYAKTGLAALIEEWDRRIKRYTVDIEDFQRQLGELQRRIGDLPRLIREAEQDSDRKLKESVRLDECAKDMDKKSTRHANNAIGSVAAAGGYMAVGILTAPITGICSYCFNFSIFIYEKHKALLRAALPAQNIQI